MLLCEHATGTGTVLSTIPSVVHGAHADGSDPDGQSGSSLRRYEAVDVRIEPRSGAAPGAASAADDVMPVELFLPSLEHALRVSGTEVGYCLSANLLPCAAEQWFT